jgi:hypothetical protein
MTVALVKQFERKGWGMDRDVISGDTVRRLPSTCSPSSSGTAS